MKFYSGYGAVAARTTAARGGFLGRQFRTHDRSEFQAQLSQLRNRLRSLGLGLRTRQHRAALNEEGTDVSYWSTGGGVGSYHLAVEHFRPDGYWAVIYFDSLGTLEDQLASRRVAAKPLSRRRRAYRGYGAVRTGGLPGEIVPWTEEMESQRPLAIPDDWVLYSRVLLVRARSLDEASAATQAVIDDMAEGWEEGVLAYPHGWDVHEFDDGTFGGSVTFWAPPGAVEAAEKKRFPWLPVALGGGALVVVGTAIFFGTIKR